MDRRCSRDNFVLPSTNHEAGVRVPTTIKNVTLKAQALKALKQPKAQPGFTASRPAASRDSTRVVSGLERRVSDLLEQV